MFKKLFQQLKPEIQIARCAVPQHVSLTKNPDDETQEQIISRQDKFVQLPDQIRGKLASHDTGKKIQQIGKTFGLELLQIANISRAIRSYYFGEIKLEDIPFVLSKEIGVDLTRGKEIAQIVIDKIINDNTLEKEYQSKLENFTINEALKKYPEVGEQVVTVNKISLKNFPEPVRPSLKNWIADYTFTVGYGEHDSIQRGNYLFQNANAKALNYEDRQKLIYTLKSFDDNLQITVNKDLKQIVFPKFATAPAPAQPQQSAPVAAPAEISYVPQPVRPVTPQAQQTQQRRVLESLPQRNLNTIANFNSQPMATRPSMPAGQKPVPAQNVVSLKPLANNRPNIVSAEPRRNVSFAPPSAIQHDKAPASLPVAPPQRPAFSTPPQPRPIAVKPAEEKFEIKAAHNNINDAKKDNINSIKFSSPQKLPYEKAKLQPYRISPVYGNADEDSTASISK